MRDRSRAALISCLEKIDATDNFALAMKTSTVKHAERLAASLDGGEIDLDICYLLGWYHFYRALAAHGVDDVEAAISYFAPCLLFGEDPLPKTLLPDLAEAGVDLANDFLTQAIAGKDLHEITLAAIAWQRVNEHTPADHPKRALRLVSEGIALRARFGCSEEPADLDRAIDCLRQAVGDGAGDSPNLEIALSNLGGALYDRFGRTRTAADLDEAVTRLRQAVETAPAGHPKRVRYLSSLGDALLDRFERTEALPDLDEAIGCLRQVIEATPADHPRLVIYLSDLGVAWRNRFEHTGDLADLDQAVAIGRRAVGIAPADHPNRPMYLSDLGDALQARFRRTGAVTDLDEAVTCLQQAVTATPASHPDHAMYLSNLGIVRRARFERTGAMADLEHAVTCLRQAVEATPADHRNHAGSLSNLGSALLDRFERLGAVADLDEAVTVRRQAVEAAAADHPGRAMYLSNLGGALQTRFRRTGAEADLEEAVSAGRQAVEATPADHPGRAIFLSNLGGALQTRFERTRAATDLDEAVTLLQQAVEATPADHPNRATYLSNLGIALLDRFEHTGTAADLEQAVDCFDSAASVRQAAVAQTIKAWRGKGRAALLAGRFDEALDAYQAAVDLLPHLVPHQLDRSDREHGLSTIAGLGADAAAAAHAAGEPRRALELLEQARGVLAGEILAVDAAVERLTASAPDLLPEFRRIREVRARLDHTPSPTGQEEHADDQVHRIGAQREHLTTEWNALIARIRSRPGLAGFLMPPDITELRRQAADGPIVTISVTRHGGLALLLTDDPGTPVRARPLPDLTQDRALRYGRLTLTACETLADRAARDRHGDARRDLVDVLAWCAQAITGPILDTLTGNGWSGGRIWWCPVGIITYLPLHAAGRHTADWSADSVLNQVVSSYAPTVRALAVGRHRRRSTADRALAVAMSSTPGLSQEADLRFAAEEAADLGALIPGTTVLRDAQATRDAVLETLSACPIAHFACHGVSDWDDPAASRLLLHDHQSAPLSVTAISGRKLTGAELAYLSACSTSSTRPDRADEAIHITAAFHLAGYRHVIGTLWQVNDAIAATMARDFYRILTRDGTTLPEIDRSAHALNEVVRVIRDRHPDRPDLWAAHIHLGP